MEREGGREKRHGSERVVDGEKEGGRSKEVDRGEQGKEVTERTADRGGG